MTRAAPSRVFRRSASAAPRRSSCSTCNWRRSPAAHTADKLKLSMQRLAVLLLLIAGGLRAETTLVLPFFNHSKTPNLDWVGESIAESVRDALASEGLLVLAREDRMEAYRR